MEMNNLEEKKSSILKLRVLYDIDNPADFDDPDEAKFKIVFIPFIGDDAKSIANVTKSFKFYLKIKRDVAQIYQFYEKIRLDTKLRKAVTSTITEPLEQFEVNIPGRTTKERLEALGLRIYRELFPLEIREYIEEYKINVIVINSNKYILPFELMHNGSSFLATKIQFYRDPIIEDKKKETINYGKKSKNLPSKVAFFTNPTGDLEDAERETSQIINFFESRELEKLDLEIDNFTFKSANYDALSYIFYMPRLDIFHYSGHSKITKKDIGFKLKGDTFSVNDLSLVYPTLFFLNMCEGDITVKQKVAFSGYEFLNFPMRVLRKGAKACVATIWPIIDKTAAEFAIEFYKQLINGDSFGKAICDAKKRLESISNPNDITWMSFILYGNPNDSHLESIGFKKPKIPIVTPIEEKLRVKADIAPQISDVKERILSLSEESPPLKESLAQIAVLEEEVEPQSKVSDENEELITVPVSEEKKDLNTLNVGLSENRNLLSLYISKDQLTNAETIYKIDYDIDYLDDLWNQLIKIMNSDKDMRKIDEVIKIGVNYYAHLFPNEIQGKLESSQSKNLELFLDTDLQKYPWELFSYSNEFLGSKFALGRFFNVKDEDLTISQVKRKSSEGIKFLIIGDPTGDLSGARSEAIFIDKKLSKIRNVKTKLLLQKAANITNIEEELDNNYDFIHFYGHVHFSIEDPIESGLVLNDGIFISSEIMRILKKSPPILVYLNGCHFCKEQTWSKSNMKFIFKRQAIDLASAFLKNGINVIETQWDVPSKVAELASLSFYHEFIRGNSIGEALRKTRNYLSEYRDLSFENDLISGSAYTLYGDPTLYIVELDEE